MPLSKDLYTQKLIRFGLQYSLVRGLFSLLFTTILLFSFDVKAQETTVSGHITFKDGTPIAFATVYIASINKHALTSESGYYQLKDVPFGNYTLQIQSVELGKQQVALSVNKRNQEFSFQLKKAAAEVLKEVQVLGTTEKKKMETEGFAMSVVEPKEAALQSIQTNDLLNRSAGVRVRQNGGLGSSVRYNLNGMTGNSIRIFIDGIPISTYGPSFSLNSIPPALIERIEIYKGVIPAHLADDALGGAINVVLKSEISNNISASISYGSFNTLQSSFSGMYRLENGLSVKASGFYNYSDNNYEVWGKFVRNILPNGRYDYVRAKRFNDAYKSVGGRLSMGFTNVKWADQFFISYNGSNDYNEIQHGTYMSIPYKGRFSESQAQVWGLTYKKSDFLFKGLEVSFNGMFSDRKEVIIDTVKWNYNWFDEISLGLRGDPILRPQGAQQGAPTINHINREIVTFRSGATYTITEGHSLIFSHAYFDISRTQQDFKRSAIDREFIGTRDLQKNVSSLAYDVELWDGRFKANVFGKYYQQTIDKMEPILVEQNGESVKAEERVSSTKNTIGYGTALSFRLTPQLVLLTSAEKAVRMPTEGEIFGSPSENIVENMGLNPEVSNNLNVGFQAGAFRFSKQKISFTATGFIRDTRDKILPLINPRINDAVQTNPLVNLGLTKAIGFEAEADYSLKNRLSLMANVSKFKSVFNQQFDANGNEYDNYNQQLPNEPYFTINGAARYTFLNVLQQDSRLNLFYNFGFVERFYTTWLEIEDFRTPRQFIHDVGCSYTFPDKRLVVSADVRNLFDKQMYDNFAVQKPGRAYYLKLNYTINNF